MVGGDDEPPAAIVEFGNSRWGAESRGWSPEMLAGFSVRDLLCGLETVLPWHGWTEARARLDRQTGPTMIARLWSAYSILPPATPRRTGVVEGMMDRSYL